MTFPWWLGLLFVILTGTISLSSPPESPCQVSMCNLTSVNIQPQLYRICTTPFHFVLRPTKVRKTGLSRRGRHFFDLFYTLFQENCVTLKVMFHLNDNHLGIIIMWQCGNASNDAYLGFSSKNILEIPFVTRDTIVPETIQTCRYHHLERFRITVLDNITLLIEDLSPLVPSGTRMFFTNRNASTEVPENQCPCRNVRRDQKRFNSCEKYTNWMIRNKELIQREAERSARDVRIAVAITVGSLVGNVIGRWWVTRRFPEYKCIASIVYVINFDGIFVDRMAKEASNSEVSRL